ncbi:hypothetical protein F5I97DRAFT_356980 [Phlebopus sp. FC_14]|nr:hypothetical protein F5I97DRAFT_356980 [Phlebopus sp. FC_14]
MDAPLGGCEYVSEDKYSVFVRVGPRRRLALEIARQNALASTTSALLSYTFFAMTFSDDLNRQAWLCSSELSIHVVSETVPWPTEVQPLTCALGVSLLHDALSNFPSDAVGTIPPSSGDTAGDGKASLRAVLNLVLSTTTLMRPGPFEPPRFALLSTLVKGLLRVLQPDCVALENCMLTFPLVSQPIEQLVNLDPRKSLLIALVYNKDCSDERMPSDDGTASLKESPLDYIPVLCVAPPDIIHAMLASTLRHHCVCGINQPVLGFTLLSPDEAVVCAVFGWLETNPDGLPRAHIAWAGPNACPNNAFGVFDLTDYCSSLAFAQFILNSQSRFEELKASLSERSDHHSSLERDDVQLGTSSQSGNRIMLWRNKIPIDAEHPIDTEQPINAQVSENRPFMSSDARKTRSTTKSERQPGIIGSIEGERPTDRGSVKGLSKKSNEKSGSGKAALTAATNATESAETKPESRESNLSNSELCAISDRGLLDSWTIDNWMLERNAMSVFRHKVSIEGNEDSGRKEIKKEINTMVDIYDEITSCTYPRSLLDEEKGPKVDPGVEGALKELREKLKSTPGCKAVDTEELSLLTQCMSNILWSSVAAFVQDALAKVYGAKEVERRQAWDSLLTCCFRFMHPINPMEPEKVGLHLSLEHSISLARNCAMEDLCASDKRTPDWSQHQKVIEDLLDVNQKVSQNLLNKIGKLAAPEAKILHAQSLELYNVNSMYTMATLKLTERITNLDNAATALEKRFARERDTAICDAVVSVCIPNFLGRVVKQFDSMNMEQQNTFVKSFAFVHRPTKEGGNTEISLGEVSRSASRASGSSRGGSKTGTQRRREDLTSFNNSHCLTTLRRNLSTDKNTSALGRNLSSIVDNNLRLPILTVEYKRADLAKALVGINQSRMYAVSATAFLANIGITDYPVFTLTADGPIGALGMAWFSKALKRTFIMERNVVTFDIAQPLGAFHFACTMLKLARHSEKLTGEFNRIEDAFYGRLKNEVTVNQDRKVTLGRTLKWTRKSQADLMDRRGGKDISAEKTDEVGEEIGEDQANE